MHGPTAKDLVLLDNPLQPANPLPPGAPPPTVPIGPLSPNHPSTQSEEDSRIEKARVIFGSRLAGPGRWEDNLRKGTIVAGVKIPPKPLEPDNCCMSGCVNCTWDIFREDLEEWRSARAEARTKLKLQKTVEFPNLDEDGLMPGGMWEGFENIPVGMKAFMETEKRLKEKHKSQESTSG
ncbi:hypothetical protein Q9L58_000105 [Maublancomyces gigas]|uniref:Oxidoreductase-like domain-containing protein n=1 Tax=Discina gigas TaxID=1032678 RepID=A0ABR3GXX7_9PEZI